ncbi:MAG: hypothetical protein ACRDHK_15395, partial [Actinomycetota bacterium]
YGPVMASMGSPHRTEFTFDLLLRAISDPSPIGPIPPRPDDDYVGAIGSGRVTAPLVGGCLWLLADSLATPWEVETEGRILFFEDSQTPPWQVDSELTHLRNAGKLDGIAGVVIGEMFECEEGRFPDPLLRSRSMEDVFEYHFVPMGIPVLFNLPLGHGTHLATIPLGVTSTVDADARTLTIDEPALAPAEGGTD